MQNAIRTLLLIVIFGPVAAGIVFSFSLFYANGINPWQDPFPDVVLDGGCFLANEFTINETAHRLEQKTGAQLAVITKMSLPADQTLEQFAVERFEQLGLGRRDHDDGLLLVIVRNPLQIRIEVGYGLEHIITDALANRIITQAMLPEFKRKLNDQAIRQGVLSAALAIAKSKGVDLKPPKPTTFDYVVGALLGLLVVVLLVVFMVKLWFSDGMGGKNDPGGWLIAAFLVWFFVGYGGIAGLLAKFKGFSAFGGGFGAFGGGASGGGGASFR